MPLKLIHLRLFYMLISFLLSPLCGSQGKKKKGLSLIHSSSLVSSLFFNFFFFFYITPLTLLMELYQTPWPVIKSHGHKELLDHTTKPLFIYFFLREIPPKEDLA